MSSPEMLPYFPDKSPTSYLSKVRVAGGGAKKITFLRVSSRVIMLSPGFLQGLA